MICQTLVVSFSADPLSNMTLSFDTKEDAIVYATEYGNLLSTSPLPQHMLNQQVGSTQSLNRRNQR